MDPLFAEGVIYKVTQTGPGDTVIFQARRPLSAQQALAIRDHIEHRMPGLRFLLVDSQWSVYVVSTELAEKMVQMAADMATVNPNLTTERAAEMLRDAVTLQGRLQESGEAQADDNAT